MACRDHKEKWVLKAQQARRANAGQRAQPALKVRQAPQVNAEHQDNRAKPALKVQRANAGPRDHKASQSRRVPGS